jgi:hypothetical protein
MSAPQKYESVRLGDIVRLRKPHPCGGFEWEVVRLGADIGIRCARCGRRVLIPRSQFVRQVKMLIQPGPDSPPSSRETPTS